MKKLEEDLNKEIIIDPDDKDHNKEEYPINFEDTNSPGYHPNKKGGQNPNPHIKF